mmetsp:Transcript_2737/g.5424  ORF Transcript_2737/g.5424 Transcript_2737/m.5424 type:complete len:247 (-) Transcript_2737:126-866(-)
MAREMPISSSPRPSSSLREAVLKQSTYGCAHGRLDFTKGTASSKSIPLYMQRYPTTVRVARLIPAVQWTYVRRPDIRWPASTRTASGSMFAWSLWSKSRTATRLITTPRSTARSRMAFQSISNASKHASDCKQMMASMFASSTRRSTSSTLRGQDPTMMLSSMASQFSVHFHSPMAFEVPASLASSWRFFHASSSDTTQLSSATNCKLLLLLAWRCRCAVDRHITFVPETCMRAASAMLGFPLKRF